MDKKTAKQNLKIILEKYQKYKNSDALEHEANAEKIIEDIFEKVLGWESLEDYVKKKSQKNRGIPDYTFRLNGINKFFLEAKKIDASLNDIGFQKQAIGYARSSSVSFAVLTNFGELRVYVVDREIDSSKNFEKSQLFKPILIENCLNESEFDKLWLLSKESFVNKKVYEFAEEICKLPKRKEIDKHLSEKLNYLREKIKNNIRRNEKYNNKITSDINSKQLLDEVTQRILDRLVFIRVCEDREYENRWLEICLNSYKEKKTNLWKSVKELFKDYNKKNEKTNVGGYDSGLFEFSLCDEIFLDENIIALVIEEFYYFDDGTPINFSKIPADVLGNLYENYLSYISKNVDIQKSHKKEQGIYYTPTYIVNYIVKNTIGELLKDKKINIEKIKILDPACGSGSFLIKAFDVIEEYYRKNDNYNQKTLADDGTTYSTKEKILKNNIFGVDLDTKAVEIAQLNLLLKIAKRGHRLPLLQQNIKHGNSLVNDENIDKNAFNWKGDFQEGSFDVVIGNPPYFNLQTINDSKIINLFETKYSSFRGKADILYLFIEKASHLLKQEGYFGMIVANYFLKSHYADKLRKLILSEFEIVKIVDFGSIKIFENANVDTCILIFRKKSKKQLTATYSLLYNKNKISEFLKDSEKQKSISSSDYKISTFSIKNLSNKPWLFSEKVSGTIQLKELCEIGKGVATGNDDVFVLDREFCEDNKFEKFMLDEIVEDSSINRYTLDISNKILLRIKRGTDLSKCPNIRKYLESKKDILQKRYAVKEEGLKWFEIVRYNDLLFSPDKKERIFAYYRSPHNKFAYTNKQAVSLTTTFVLVLKESSNVSLKYLLGLLNSRLIQNFSLKNAKRMGECFEFSSNFISSIPIKACNKKKETEIVSLVNKMLSLSKRLSEIGRKTTSETKDLNDKINSLNKEIDEEIYKLYGITDKEKKIIEESLK